MAYKIGDIVHVHKLGRRRGTIVGVRKANLYEVVVGSLTILSHTSELSVAQAPPPNTALQVPTHPPTNTKQPRVIDLHGYTKASAAAAVSQAVNDAILRGENELHIMHGIGTGAVQKAVHKTLFELPVVKSFKLDLSNPGLTRVFL